MWLLQVGGPGLVDAGSLSWRTGTGSLNFPVTPVLFLHDECSVLRSVWWDLDNKIIKKILIKIGLLTVCLWSTEGP